MVLKCPVASDSTLKRIQMPTSMKKDIDVWGNFFTELGNLALGILCPLVYAAKTSLVNPKNSDWYLKTRSALLRSAITGAACLTLSYFGDSFMTNLEKNIRSSNQVQLEQGILNYAEVWKRTIEDDSILKRTLFPIIRAYTPNTYGWKESHTVFSGHLKKEGLEFQVQGAFPDVRDPSGLTLEDLKGYITNIHLEKDNALDYLTK